MCWRERLIFSGNRMLWFICCSVRWFIYQVRNVNNFFVHGMYFPHNLSQHPYIEAADSMESNVYFTMMYEKRRDPSTRRTDSRDNPTDWFGLFVYPFSHVCNIGHVNYRLQFTTHNIWTSTQYNIRVINNNTKFKDQLEVEFVTTSRFMCIYINIPKSSKFKLKVIE